MLNTSLYWKLTKSLYSQADLEDRIHFIHHYKGYGLNLYGKLIQVVIEEYNQRTIIYHCRCCSTLNGK